MKKLVKLLLSSLAPIFVALAISFTIGGHPFLGPQC